MSDHPPDALLDAFALGEVGDHVAVALAEHVDACARCRARVLAADPLTQAFASVDDPPVPDDLVTRVLAAARAAPPVTAPRAATWWHGAALLALAACLVLPAARPAALVAAARELGGALHVASMLAAKPWLAPALALFAALFGVSALWTAALPRRRVA